MKTPLINTMITTIIIKKNLLGLLARVKLHGVTWIGDFMRGIGDNHETFVKVFLIPFFLVLPGFFEDFLQPLLRNGKSR